jgi:SPW repeat-containing protein
VSDGVGYRHSDATYYLVHNVEPDLRALAGHAHRRVKIRGRALEVSAMTAWKRWQDWSVVVLGAIMFVTPFAFAETSQTVAASAAYVLGVLIVLAGLLNAAMARAGGLEIIPAVLAVILFVSPFAFGFTGVTALAWSAYIIAILVVLAVGSLFAMQTRRATA